MQTVRWCRGLGSGQGASFGRSSPPHMWWPRPGLGERICFVEWGTTVQWGLLLWSNELSLPPGDRQGLGGDGVQLLLASVCRAKTWEDAEKPALVLTGQWRASLPCEGVIQERVTNSVTSEWVGIGAGARETWVRIQHTPEALGQFLNLPELYFATQPSPWGRWEDHRRWGGSRLVADS